MCMFVLFKESCLGEPCGQVSDCKGSPNVDCVNDVCRCAEGTTVDADGQCVNGKWYCIYIYISVIYVKHI